MYTFMPILPKHRQRMYLRNGSAAGYFIFYIGSSYQISRDYPIKMSRLLWKKNQIILFF